jgi:Flp pilus assembly protein TadD
MASEHRSPRRSMALALLATTAIAAVLGGCTQTGLSFSRLAGESKISANDQFGAVAQWSAAYAKDPQNPKNALGYALALKALGSRDRALEILIASYQANRTNGEVAAELGRLALDMDRLDIAAQTLKVAEAQGVKDWKTLSAQGTLRAKQGQPAEAQQYFLAALQQKPDAVSVINNLALSYALDGKPEKSEELLRKAVASGQGDKRVRQNLAMVLGLQGKFEEARQVAEVDMSDQEATSSMAYLRNMMAKPTQFAAGPAGDGGSGDEWQPFASNDAVSSKTAAAAPVAPPKVQMVKATEEIEAPSPAAAQTKTAKAAAPATKPKLAGTPSLITPVNATPAQVKAATTSVAPADAAGLLRTNTD